jgi:hypothetical protein
LTQTIYRKQQLENGQRKDRNVVAREAKAKPPSQEYSNFEKLAKQLISVPKSEIDKREAEYQKAKKTHKKKRIA